MSIKTEIICNKCGKEIVNDSGCYKTNYAIYRYSARIQLWGVNEPRGYGGQRIDLCPKCYEEFINFLEGGGDNA